MLVLGGMIHYSFAEIDPSRIVGIWLLDEGKGNIATDVSGKWNSGTITQGRWQKDLLNGALEIARGGTVTIPLDKGAVLNKMSFTLWLQFTDIQEQQNYFSLYDQNRNRYVPYKSKENLLRYWTNNWDISSDYTVKAGTWYHVANVYDGKTASIYINGDEKVSQDVPKFQLQDQDQTAWLATDSGWAFLSACIMDEVGLFKDALTKDEIHRIMNDGIYAFAMAPADKLSTLWEDLKETETELLEVRVPIDAPSTVSLGEHFTVSINIEEAVDLAGVQFDLHFDPAVLEATDVQEGGFLIENSAFFQVEHFASIPGEISGIRIARGSGVDGKGTLLKVIFRAKAPGVSVLEIKNMKLGNSAGQTLLYKIVDASVAVESSVDVTGDGKVDILDLVRVARHFGPASAAPVGVDVNGDGDVDILDLIFLAQHLGG